jgi:hypothetical protein
MQQVIGQRGASILVQMGDVLMVYMDQNQFQQNSITDLDILRYILLLCKQAIWSVVTSDVY